MIKKTGFTLVELLVVITIIMIITTSGTLYFFKFLDSTNLKTDISNIQSDINTFDTKIKNYEIFDYELNFDSGSLGYTYYINKFDIPFSQSIELDFNTGTGIIKTDTVMTGGIRVLKIYKKYKLFSQRVLSSNDIYTGSFNDSSFYKLEGSINGDTLNTIGIKYYIDSNISNGSNTNFTLDIISKNKDKTGICNNLQVKNIGGKKTISCGNIKVSTVYLFFYKNGIEDFIKIN